MVVFVNCVFFSRIALKPIAGSFDTVASYHTYNHFFVRLMITLNDDDPISGHILLCEDGDVSN